MIIVFFRETAQGVVLNIRVMPNAASCVARGLFADANGVEYLKVAVISVPEKGKANKELLTFLAKQLNLPKSCMELISGETDRYKRVLIQRNDEAVLQQLKIWQEKAENDS